MNYDTEIKPVIVSIIKEKLAALAHEQWSGWMRYLFSKTVRNKNGTVTIPKWAVKRWERQANSLYNELSEKEKQNDREEADKVILIIKSK